MSDKAHSFPFLFASEFFKLLIPIITDLTENRTTQGLYCFTNNYLSVYEVTNYSFFVEECTLRQHYVRTSGMEKNLKHRYQKLSCIQ